MLERLIRVQRLCNGFLFRAPICSPEYTSKGRLAACSCPLVETNFVFIRKKRGGSRNRFPVGALEKPSADRITLDTKAQADHLPHLSPRDRVCVRRSRSAPCAGPSNEVF